MNDFLFVTETDFVTFELIDNFLIYFNIITKLINQFKTDEISRNMRMAIVEFYLKRKDQPCTTLELSRTRLSS